MTDHALITGLKDFHVPLFARIPHEELKVTVFIRTDNDQAYCRSSCLQMNA